MSKAEKKLWLIFFIFLIGNAGLWLVLRQTQAKWMNVPPVPGKNAVYASALGDGKFAYRSLGIMLQNLGDTGGRSTSLHEYDYDALGRWFFLMDSLDHRSNYLPYVAAYYYGALEGEPDKLRNVVKYLHAVGLSIKNEKWRWLAHAVHLARFKMNDLNLSYSMAKELAALADEPGADLPNWARQMPAFVLNQQGEKEAAYQLMLEILSSVGDKLHPNEINHTRGYICEQILTPEEAKDNPICQGDF